MNQKYALLDENGFPIGFYDSDIHRPRTIEIIDPEYVEPFVEVGQFVPEPPYITVPNPNTKIPLDAIEITNDQWIEMLENQGRRKLVNGVLEIYTPPVDPNAEIQRQINILEASITPRRLREAVLGTDNGWLAAIEDEIEDLRTQLV